MMNSASWRKAARSGAVEFLVASQQLDDLGRDARDA
jgi:hypothetical protein